MTTHPATIDLEAVRAAASLRTDIARRIKRLEAASVVAAACARFPGRSAVQAVAELTNEVTGVLSAFATVSDKAGADFEADRTRTQPAFDVAVARHFEVTKRIKDLGNIIPQRDKTVAEQRGRMHAAGVPLVDIDRLCQPADTSGLHEEQSRLSAENELLLQFIKTRDESLLPADFMALHGHHLAGYRSGQLTQAA
jgi:hypothetical protein